MIGRSVAVIGSFPKVARLIFVLRLVLLMSSASALLLMAQKSVPDRVTIIEQQFSDQQKDYDSKVRDLGTLKEEVKALALTVESRMTKLESNSDFTQKLMFLVVGAIFVQLLETAFSYMRVRRSMMSGPGSMKELREHDDSFRPRR